MKVRFADKRLELVETDQAHKVGLPVAVIMSARKKIQLIRAANDERDLRSMKSLNFKRNKGKRDGECSVRLNDQYRITMIIDETCSPHEIMIMNIGDTH
jgi:toxin HigB-1